MRRELRLPRVIRRQGVRQGSNPIADLKRKMRCRRANHLHKLSLIWDGIDVFENSHANDLATAGHSGDRR